MRKIASIVAFALLLTSCSWLKSELGSVEHVAIDCTVPAVVSKLPELVPVVLAILQGQSPDWAAMLAALESVGKEALACAVNQAGAQLAHVAKAGPDGELSPITKAQEFIENQGWTFKGSK